MSEQTGKIGWVDMTVDDAAALRDFYADVVGLRPEPVSMGDYHYSKAPDEPIVISAWYSPTTRASTCARRNWTDASSVDSRSGW